MIKKWRMGLLYSSLTLLLTVGLGQLLLWLFPTGDSIGASLLFIVMNLVPMLVAGICSISSQQSRSIVDFFQKVFFQKEKAITFALALSVPLMYYGISIVLNNVNFTGASVALAISYFPWTFLQGGLEEVGWRWYLQKEIGANSHFILRIVFISIIWFLWHIPIYRLPWITAGSNNILIFYLIIFGNSFTLGMVREFSKGAVPCILAHMLINTLATLMLLQNSLLAISGLVVFEIILSCLIVCWYHKQKVEA